MPPIGRLACEGHVEEIDEQRLQRSVGDASTRLDLWATNPWRRASLLLIALTGSFMIGNGIASISGSLGLMDPVAAMLSAVLRRSAVLLRCCAVLCSGA